MIAKLEAYKMKKFDIKSFVAGFLLGTVGITTAFAATGIQSANLCDTQVTLNGVSLSLSKSLISVTMNDEQDASLYVPANELLEKLGYTVYYDHAKNRMDLVSGNNNSHKETSQTSGNAIIDLSNHPGQLNIAESGSFQAENNQTLTLNVTSDIKGGTVDFFLFDPEGKELHITIDSADMKKEIPLEKGIWKYNCSGIFKDGGNIKIVGTIK